MARLLVKATNYTHPDPNKDKQGAYKRGDVVAVVPDDHVWGKKEGLPSFEQVDMPGVSVAELKHLINSEIESSYEVISKAAWKNNRLRRLLSKTKSRNTKTRRRYSIDLDTQQVTDKAK